MCSRMSFGVVCRQKRRESDTMRTTRGVERETNALAKRFEEGFEVTRSLFKGCGLLLESRDLLLKVGVSDLPCHLVLQMLSDLCLPHGQKSLQMQQENQNQDRDQERGIKIERSTDQEIERSRERGIKIKRSRDRETKKEIKREFKP